MPFTAWRVNKTEMVILLLLRFRHKSDMALGKSFLMLQENDINISTDT